jgi:valyl-tRNA synthetase
MTELSAIYEPKAYESKWYNFWMEKKLFEANKESGKKPYTILMPPPNVTEKAHMGHGMGYTIQDLYIRWKRMSGFDALWLPGTDHAGIATQMMVEKALLEEGTSREEIGREKFFERCMKWKDDYGSTIIKQFKGLGFSADWSREVYTMDAKLSKAVRKLFVEFFDEGLIYRGERLVNWDPYLKTAVSDDEVENKEINGHLWFFRYPVENSDEYLTIATTRPETMLGDSAVAVNPKDERYKHLIGKKVVLPLTERLIPVVGDEYVDMEFGTGCLKITPAHDPNDFELGKRHNLPFINVMNDDATMADHVPDRFKGLERFKCRKEIVKAMKELGLFEKEISHKHSVPHGERSKQIIEPKLSLQWYVSMKKLAESAVEVVKSGEIKFYPDLWKKTYFHWMDNIEDWCISRQLWWGHRIPIWYCDDCDAVSTGIEDPVACCKCGSKKIRQDEDVLDTWFSSCLWPVSPLGWPDETEDLNHYYPTDLMVTAPDIIFLWVARMVMAGLKTRGQIPFQDVYMTPVVCDAKGQKFSKTLRNGIDPLEVIDKHGTDAVRFTAIHLAPLGGRVKMSLDDFDVGARFVNKLWNASRFLFGHIEDGASIEPLDFENMDKSLCWLLNGLANTAEAVDRNLNDYRVNDAVHAIYYYIWDNFCDWGLESAKNVLAQGDSEHKRNTISVLIYALEGILRLAHPVMPFVTEEIWQNLPAHPNWERGESIVVAEYPTCHKLPRFEKEAAEWEVVKSLISGIRSVRSQANIPQKKKLTALVNANEGVCGLLRESESYITSLASLTELTVGPEVTNPGKCLIHVGNGFEVYIPADGLLDIEKEAKRLSAEAERIKKIVAGLNNKLANKNFVDHAPEEVVVQTKSQLENMQAQLDSIEKNLTSLG